MIMKRGLRQSTPLVTSLLGGRSRVWEGAMDRGGEGVRGRVGEQGVCGGDGESGWGWGLGVR